MDKQEFQTKLYTVLDACDLSADIKGFLKPYLDIDKAVAEISPRGKGQGVKTNKPKNDNVYAYIWRMARFNSGADVTLPITAQWHLSDALKPFCPSPFDKNKKYGDEGYFNDEQSKYNHHVEKVASDLLDALSMICVKLLKGDALAGAKRWHKAIYG